jgi:hypothetical protein
MGCIARLGCLILLAVILVGGWFTRGLWLPERYRTALSGHKATPAAAPSWQPLSGPGADRTRTALNTLSQPHGAVFQTLTGADVASYVFTELAKSLPPSTDSLRARVRGDSIGLRASVKLSDLGGAADLGPLANVLGDRERVELTGTLRVVSAGVAEFEVRGLHVGRIAVPQSLIPRLVRQLDKAKRPAGLDDDAVPLSIPAYVGDIRVANGKITLYKSTG